VRGDVPRRLHAGKANAFEVAAIALRGELAGGLDFRPCPAPGLAGGIKPGIGKLAAAPPPAPTPGPAAVPKEHVPGPAGPPAAPRQAAKSGPCARWRDSPIKRMRATRTRSRRVGGGLTGTAAPPNRHQAAGPALRRPAAVTDAGGG
jgi:hypothetical protein